jgi:hypothetical protein
MRVEEFNEKYQNVYEEGDKERAKEDINRLMFELQVI